MSHNTITGIIREMVLYSRNLPHYLEDYYHRKMILRKTSQYKEKILCEKEIVLKALPDASDIIQYIEDSNSITYFNSDFENSYLSKNVEVFYDKNEKMKYVDVDNNRIYYPRSFSSRHISYTFQSVMLEQTKTSPHRYLDDDENLNDTILFDCGTAEGSFTFAHVEEIKKAYLFEGDSSWTDPLNATFSPWRDKITIINNYLGSGERQLSLRHFIIGLIDDKKIDCEKDSIFIKMDVEGSEPELMREIATILHRFKNVRLAVCVYHYNDDEEKVISVIPEGFCYHTRPGYMFFAQYENRIEFPYFRHGVLRIEREG